MRIRAHAVALATAVCAALVVHQASAQQVLVSGKVTDTWGNPLEGVQVEAKQPEGGGSPRTEVTNADGEFRMIGLDTTDYERTARSRLPANKKKDPRYAGICRDIVGCAPGVSAQ